MRKYWEIRVTFRSAPPAPPCLVLHVKRCVTPLIYNPPQTCLLSSTEIASTMSNTLMTPSLSHISMRTWPDILLALFDRILFPPQTPSGRSLKFPLDSQPKSHPGMNHISLFNMMMLSCPRRSYLRLQSQQMTSPILTLLSPRNATQGRSDPRTQRKSYLH